MNKYAFIILGLLAIAAAIFEFHPAVEKAQSYVSLENYKDSETLCQNLLNERPWHGKLNYWFFIWLIFVPVLIFSVSPNASAWIRGGRVIIAAAACYVFMNLAVHLQWDIRNALFQEDPFNPNPLNGWRMDCVNVAGDGFSYVLALGFAWIPASLYTGLCLYVWSQYHRQWSQKIDVDFKTDILSYLFSRAIIIYLIMVLLCVASVALFIMLAYIQGEPPFHSGYMGLIYVFIIRPLFIPIEIFFYS